MRRRPSRCRVCALVRNKRHGGCGIHGCCGCCRDADWKLADATEGYRVANALLKKALTQVHKLRKHVELIKYFRKGKA